MKSRTVRVLIGVGAGALILVAGVAYALMASFVYLAPSLPSSEGMRTMPLQVPLRVYTRSGELISQIGEQRRVPVSYEEIPPLVREAFVAAEDERFFEHGGVDALSVLRSVWVDVKGGGFSQGGSTITMQTARNMFLTKDKHIQRKLQEVFLTLRMERDFTKQQILETYLNVIFLGQRAYGVAAAAEVYFGKPLNELSVAEAAMLAGLPQAPSQDNPVANPQRATERRRYVLQRMLARHFIDADTERRAAAEEIHAREYAPHFDVEAPYVAEMVRQKVIERFGDAAINAGYRAITTIDGRLQTAANRALRLGLIEYDRRHGFRGALRNVSLAEGADTRALEATLNTLPPVGNLQPAVVVSVAPAGSRVYVRASGFAQISADGLAWARAKSSGPRSGDLLRRGDLVYVLSNGRGAAQLAQIPEAQGALVALDPQDGAIAALIGGFDYFSNAYNRVTQAHRQPGSGFKPFLYSDALEHEFTPSSVIMDAPIVVADSSVEQTWRPENDGGTFSGPMRLREALVHSRNLVSIRLLRAVGTSDVIDYATRFGFDRSGIPDNLTLALGTLTATPLQVATGYAAFANGGFKIEPYLIQRIENATGETVWQAAPREVCAACEGADAPGATATSASAVADAGVGANPAMSTPDAKSGLTLAPSGPERLTPLIPAARRAPRIISAANAWLMDDIMADVIKRGTGRRALVLNRNDISGKTGTTKEARDTWFNGFNQQLVATVWVGFDQERPLGEGEEGSSVAVPIWVRLMREGLRGLPDVPRPQPPGLVTARIDSRTGLLAAEGAADSLQEYFFSGKLPVAGSGANTPDSANGDSLF